jgi:hypothetical protein
MDRQIIRRWSRNRVVVSTLHPQLGELDRGRIWPAFTGRPADPQARGQWDIQDADAVIVAENFVGDYLDAEAALLAASPWADELLDTEELGPLADDLAELHAPAE